MEIDPFKISKRQLGKIKAGGVFEGRNIFDIEESGNLVSEETKRMQKFREGNENFDEKTNQKRKTKLREKDVDDKQTQKERVAFKKKIKKRNQGYM